MKRTFTGQLMLIISLIFLTLMVLSVATQALYYQSTRSIMEDDLKYAARAAADMTELYSSGAYSSERMLRFQLNYTARATGNDAAVLSSDGTVVACSCGMQSCEPLGTQYDQTVLDKATASGTFFSNLKLGGYAEPRMACVVKGGSFYVAASAAAVQFNDQMGDALRINLVAVLVVMLLSLPLVWIIVQRQTKPIKDMTAAARKLAHGQMDARVPTGGANSLEMDELAVAFNNMAQALQTSELKRQEFVANVSHELKTPMTTISGYMDGMLDGTIPEQDRPRYMAVISEEVKRLSRLVRSMLEISRLQDKGIPPERKKSFDICETVGQVLISFEQKINRKGLDVQVDLPEQGAKVYADPDAITQVVYNLTDNAVKFCPEGGILSFALRQTKQNKYLVSVKNTGPTIPPEELPLVFDRFHKTDKSRSVDRDGVGLGLYIVKTIIGSHEEDIYVTSRDGVTEFSFTLQKG